MPNPRDSFSLFLREAFGKKWQPTPFHEAMAKYIQDGGEISVCLSPQALYQPKPLVPGIAYIVPAEKLETYRERAAREGLRLVEHRSPQPGSAMFEVRIPGIKRSDPPGLIVLDGHADVIRRLLVKRDNPTREESDDAQDTPR